MVSEIQPRGVVGFANRLRLPLAVQYVVLAPVVAVMAVIAAVSSACVIAWETTCDAYSAIRDGHARTMRARAELTDGDES